VPQPLLAAGKVAELVVRYGGGDAAGGAAGVPGAAAVGSEDFEDLSDAGALLDVCVGGVGGWVGGWVGG
jgi:hypothetical protein